MLMNNKKFVPIAQLNTTQKKGLPIVLQSQLVSKLSMQTQLTKILKCVLQRRTVNGETRPVQHVRMDSYALKKPEKLLHGISVVPEAHTAQVG